MTFKSFTNAAGKVVGGVTGSFNASVVIDVPGVSFTGAFAVQFDTTTATPTFRVEGTGVQLTIAGQSLGAETFVISSGPSGVSIAGSPPTICQQ